MGSLVESILSAVLLMFCTRLNGTEIAGMFSISFATATILNAIGDFGIRIYQVTDTNRKYKFSDYLLSRIVVVTLMVIIGLIFIIFGILIAITAIAIFPSESSWGSIYSVLGAIISLIGINKFTKKLSYPIRLLCNFGYFIIFIIILITIDYIGVINIHQAPRFALFKITGEDTIYYDTPFYDVVRCNVNESNEEFKVFKNQTYDKNNIDKYCK